jgi:hypothetical protein
MSAVPTLADSFEHDDFSCITDLIGSTDMKPLGFVPDLSMRGVGITRLKETTFMARLQPIQGCALATDTPPPMAAAILWSASPGH